MVRRRSSEAAEGVELNLTSMLDVVFNILAFFVMTFSPPEAEKNFDVNLPPPLAGAVAAGAQEMPPDDVEPELFESITITLTAGPGGRLGGIRLEQKPIPVRGPGGAGELARELRLMAGALRGAGKDTMRTATIVASGQLKYEALIAAVDACYQANLTKINFAESGPAAQN